MYGAKSLGVESQSKSSLARDQLIAVRRTRDKSVFSDATDKHIGSGFKPLFKISLLRDLRARRCIALTNRPLVLLTNDMRLSVDLGLQRRVQPHYGRSPGHEG